MELTRLSHACGATYEPGAVFCPGCRQPLGAQAMPLAVADPSMVLCPHCERETPPGERCVRCLDLLAPADGSGTHDVPQGLEDEWQRVNLPAPLRDKYVFLRELASGGQADVLICSEAHDPNSLVVVKIYRPGVSVEDAAIAELRAGATDPTYVVPILDFGRTGGVAWEVQEYVPGGSLADVFAGPNPLGRTLQPDFGVALRLTRQLWAALTYLHERHLIHRDLKPSNVLVRRDQPLDIALADFGLVAMLEATLDIRTVVGTQSYLPPESRGSIVSAAMDWWAMGLILVEALTGRHLFAGPDGMLAEAVVRNQLYEGTFAVPTSGSPRWDALLQGLLTVDYEQRWGSEEVGDWLQGRAVRAREVVVERRGGSLPFEFGGRTYADPVALAAGIREHRLAAERLLSGQGADDLRIWLRRTSVGDAAEALLLEAAADPDAALVRLQLVLDPHHPPAYRNRLLTNAGLNGVIRAAADGDESAGAWIRDLRAQRILGVWGELKAARPESVRQIEDEMRSRWNGLEAALASAPPEVRTAVRAPLEAAILDSAIHPARGAELVAAGRAAAKGEFEGWAAGVASAASASHPSVGEAALAYVALPKLAKARAVRVEVEKVAAREARVVERVVVRDARQEAMGEELRQSGLGWAGLLVLTAWGMHHWSGAGWTTAFGASTVLVTLAATAIAARHLVAPKPDARVGWAFFAAAVVQAGQDFARSFTTADAPVPWHAWWMVALYVVLGAWLARAMNIVVSSRVRHLPVPDVIPAQWLRRPAWIAAAIGLAADASRRYAEVAAATRGVVGDPVGQLAKDIPHGAHDLAIRLSSTVHPFALGLPGGGVTVAAAFVATLFLFGSPDLARLDPALLTGVRAATVVLGALALAVVGSTLVIVTAGAGAVWLLMLGIAGCAVWIAAEKASA